jgi:hypothetical protein
MLAAPVSTSATGTLDQSQTNGGGGSQPLFGALRQVAQTFTAGITGSLDQVNLLLSRVDSPGDLTVQIKATVGGTPSGLPLASATVPAASVPTGNGGWVSVPLNPPAPSTAGTQYAIVLSHPHPTFCGGPPICMYSWNGAFGNPYPAGAAFVSTDGGVSWTAQTGFDLAFQTFVTPLQRCNERDGNGDIDGEHHTGKAHFHMDEDNCEDNNGEHVDNPVSFDNAASALTITGIGLDNGRPVSFTAVAVDHGATALDTFSIVLSNGYHNAGHLLDGAITLH